MQTLKYRRSDRAALRRMIGPAVVALSAAALAGSAFAQEAAESALIDKLVQKGVLSTKDGQELQAELETEAAQNAAGKPPGGLNGKFDISAPVTSIQLFGDLRIRYAVNEGTAGGRDVGDVGQRDRLRYALHLGANVHVTDGWTMGFVLESSANARSSNVTLGSTGYNAGNFAKGNVTTATAVTSISTTTVPVLTGLTTTSGSVTGSVLSASYKIPGVAIPVVQSVKGTSTSVLVSAKTTSGKVISGVADKTATVLSGDTYGDEVFFGQVFLKYQPTDWATIEVGKFRPNLVSTRMVWSDEINPEGIGENFLWHFGADSGAHGDPGPAGYDKDGKESKIVAPASHGISFDLFANFAQYVYDDAGFENAYNTGNGTASSPLVETPDNTSNWMLGFQIGGKVNFTPTTYFTIAPTYYCYTEGGSFSNTGFFNGDSPLVIVNKNAEPALLTFNQTSTNNLGVFDVPVQFGSKIGPVPFTVFGDFADNLYASERAANAGHPDKGNEGVAWQAGLSLGEIKKKGDWEIRGWYQKSEEFALDPNITDYNIFDGRLNMEGFYVKATYALADAVNVSLEYSNGHRIDSSLGTPGTGVLGTPAGFLLQTVNFVYVNFGVKF
jgi:Putative porin